MDDTPPDPATAQGQTSNSPASSSPGSTLPAQLLVQPHRQLAHDDCDMGHRMDGDGDDVDTEQNMPETLPEADMVASEQSHDDMTMSDAGDASSEADDDEDIGNDPRALDSSKWTRKINLALARTLHYFSAQNGYVLALLCQQAAFEASGREFSLAEIAAHAIPPRRRLALLNFLRRTGVPLATPYHEIVPWPPSPTPSPRSSRAAPTT